MPALFNCPTATHIYTTTQFLDRAASNIISLNTLTSLARPAFGEGPRGVRYCLGIYVVFDIICLFKAQTLQRGNIMVGSWQDLVNGAFELGGGLFVLNHCRVLFADKKVAGVSVLTTLIFTCWGIWNIYYYQQLSQFLSVLAAGVMLVANIVYVSMLMYYTRNPGGRGAPLPTPGAG